MSLAKVICLTKNEYDLVEDFITFYGSIFGYDNIIIIDNGSDLQDVKDVYEKYTKRGVVVEYDKRPMTDMNKMITEKMSAYKGSAKFLLPIDTDEFIYLPNQTTFDPKKVLSYLESIPDNVSIIKYSKFMGSLVDPRDDGYSRNKYQHPARSIKRFFNQGWDKCIVRADKFVSISMGNHNAQVSGGDTITTDILGLLHFHKTGAKRDFERCVQSITGYRQFNVEMPIEIQVHIAPMYIENMGGHRVRKHIEFIRRMFAVNTFIEIVNRPPTMEETERFVKLINPYKIYAEIYKNAETLKQNTAEYQNYHEYLEDLVYHEEKDTNEDESVISQVSEYLASSVSVDAVSDIETLKRMVKELMEENKRLRTIDINKLL